MKFTALYVMEFVRICFISVYASLTIVPLTLIVLILLVFIYVLAIPVKYSSFIKRW